MQEMTTQKTLLPVCQLSEADLCRLSAYPATVTETSADSSFIEMLAQIGGRKRKISGFIGDYELPKVGDRLAVIIHERNWQLFTKILGFLPSRNEREDKK